MSSPIYELLKRPDELFVVEHAHLQPRFVEDSVRISLQSTLERYAELDDDDFVLARQLNFETIHSHDVAGRALAGPSVSFAASCTTVSRPTAAHRATASGSRRSAAGT